MPKTIRSSTSKTLARAVSILTAVSSNCNRISDISRKLNLSNPTVHRLLQSMVEADLIVKDATSRRYYLGHLLDKLSSNPLVTHQHLIISSYEKIEYIRRVTEETTELHVKHGVERIRLVELTGTHNLSYKSTTSITNPIWTGAVGKALLSQLSDEELEVIINSLKLIPYTKNTITDKQAFKKEIDKVKQQGYATSYSEWSLGVASFAVPIRNYFEPASLTILGPEARLSTHKIDFVNELKKKANEISRDCAAKG